jgi:hypothetical protein
LPVSGSEDGTLLFATGGCSAPRQERKGPASNMLVELVNKYCATTHDFGGQQ